MREGATAVLRAGEWWDYKLVPILTFFYATAALLGASVSNLWSAGLLLLLSLLPGAAYVSVINDITDVADDLAAGKRNRMAGRSPVFKVAAVILTLAGGGVFFWIWRGNSSLTAIYAGAWISFTLYSVPPFRLKMRGLAGVVADAAGAHLFPTLLAVVLTFSAAAVPVDLVWLIAAAAASLGYGLRGNLWHQLLDREQDRAAGVNTYAARHAPHVAARFGTFFAFPLELVGLAILFWKLESIVPLLALAVHLGLTYVRMRLWHRPAVIAAPKPGFFIFLHEYYDVLLPLSLLLASAWAYPIDLLVLLAHLLLFHGRARAVGEDLMIVLRGIRKHALKALRSNS